MNINTKFASVSALAILALLFTPLTTTVHAENEPQAADSTATMGILENKDSGALSLNSVPDLDFGKATLTGQNDGDTFVIGKLDENGGRTDQPLDKDPFAQVTDMRNTGAGWNLTVKYDKDGDFKTTDPANPKELKGAILSFGVPTFEANVSSVSDAPTGSKDPIAVSDAEATIASAAKDQGMGIWNENFEQKTTTLHIPVGNTVGDYKATLVWTLTDAMQA